MKSKNFRDNEISGLVPEAGAIFMSNCATLEECFERKLFGLPSSYADFVREVRAGMILFLFEYENRRLYGVFEASCDGEMNIVPYAYSSTGKKFPAQVRFNTVWHCRPFNENEFYDSIKKNYFTRNKFHFGLSDDQVDGLLKLFNVRNVEVVEVQDKTRTKKRHCKHLNGNEKMEKGRTRSRRKQSHGNSHLVGRQQRSTPCKDTDNYEALVVPSSMVSGTGCSSLGHESGMSSFGWGRQPSMSRVEPENLKPSSEDLGDFIPLSLPGSLSYYNEPVMYKEEPENLKLPTQDLRAELGDFIPLSFTANKPNMYREEPEILKHPSQDLRTNLGDFIPLCLTANEPSMHNHLKHPSQDLRTNLGDFIPLSLVANEPSLYKQVPENLKHPSQDLRTNQGDFIPLSFTANEPSFYKQEPDNLKHASQDLRTDLGDFIPLSFTANEPSLYRQEELENLEHSSQDHRTELGDFIPLSLTANEPSLYREEPENLKQSSQYLRTDLRDLPVSFSDNVSDYNGNTSGNSGAKERVSVFARLGKVSESDRRDNCVFTRLQWGNSKRKKKIINAKSTVQAKRANGQGEISVETSSDTLQENDQWKTLTRETVVSTQNRDEYHFSKGQMGQMLKERDLTEERDSADDHWKGLIKEPVASVENREYKDNFKKGTQMKKMDSTEESESVDDSKRKLEHRPRRKLIRPSFYKSPEVKDSCPNSSSVNEQLRCQESSVGNANNGQCAETRKSNRTDGEEEVPPVTSLSHCKGDNLTDHDSKLGDVFGENSVAVTVSKPLTTYQRRLKKFGI